MPLPDADDALLDPRKLLDYLLSETHPVGRHKARLFRALGHTRAAVDRLVEDLMAVARSGRLIAVAETDFGWRYIVEGRVATPSGVVTTLRTVSIVSSRSSRPRFVTAYPVFGADS